MEVSLISHSGSDRLIANVINGRSDLNSPGLTEADKRLLESSVRDGIFEPFEHLVATVRVSDEDGTYVKTANILEFAEGDACVGGMFDVIFAILWPVSWKLLKA